MRIAHVITRMILGGAQENTLLTCVDLIRDWGDEVLLITGPPSGPEGSLLDQAVESGVPLHVIPELCRAIQPWYDWISYRKILHALADFHPQVVHTHSAKGGVLGRAAAWNLGVQAIVHTVHGAPFHPYQSWPARSAIRWCEFWAAQRCHALVSVADAMTDLLVDAGVAPRAMFTTVYSGMEVEPFLHADEHRDAVRAALGYGPDDIVIAKVARLFRLKGHDDLITAAERVLAACPQARFLLVGDGLLRESLQARIAAAGMTPQFHFTGLVPPQRVPEFLAAADIVVHTSLREGLARVLPQALIAGKPVVSYDIDGAREVVLPGQTGCLIPPRQVGDLADALILLAQNSQLRQAYGEEGRRRCAPQFSHSRMTAQLRTLYTRLLTPPSVG